MQHNIELVKEIYHNAEMSKDLLRRLIKICNDASFTTALAKQFAEYHEIVNEAKAICDSHCYPVKPLTRLKRMACSGISVTAMIDKTPSHLAEMVVQGSTMGVIDMQRALREYSGADDEITELARKLLQTEKSNAEKILDFV